ncbi:Protein O-mannosyltransferase 2 [Clydaea vesicula]|uniref:Dolichyl-phosphate-mannose--protein mannosyltransferase n=1 Tax=Clydaea vesicula TaxID=447962 RepID=A0AAD5UA00_9FUNG|nr:Protein O-mannosyltransferase 2 [Clydaea vesicula]
MNKEGLRYRAEKDPLLQYESTIEDEKDHPEHKVYKPKLIKQSRLQYFLGGDDWKTPTILIFLAFVTRIYKISWANFVVWDEAHFGKFASYYLKREFYFDVHPPLGKMLLGLSGVFAGYNGSFPFESGAVYPPELNYTVMRIFSASYGAMMVPMAYFTAIQLKMSHSAATLAAVMVLLDSALLTISRFILLDSMLLYFTCQSVFCFVTYRNYQRTTPFSTDWWFWMAATGVSIGCVASVKWVGLFAIALVGFHTISDLWDLLGDLKMPKKTYFMHWVARISCLIVIPVVIYLFSFWMHFLILNRSGSGDAQMSSLFQAGLEGNSFDQNPLEIAYGSKVSLKNNGHGGGLLHSHVQRYPTGSEQQQVTCYHHKDANNEFIITEPWTADQIPNGIPVDPEAKKDMNEDGTVRFLQDGDIIRLGKRMSITNINNILVHDQTSRNLHSHQVKAPITTKDNEVSCYGNATVGDANDHWKIELADDVRGKKNGRIRSLSSRFRLRHVTLGCLLRSEGVTLPEWGFKQAEVVCQKKADKWSNYNLWNVELHVNALLPPAGANVYRSRFFRDFLDLNVAMWTSNNALTPDPDKEPDGLTSSPYEWPLLTTGLRMCSWAEDAVKFFLIGHPIVWWCGAFSVLACITIFVFYIVRAKRKVADFDVKNGMSDSLNYI